VEVVIVGAGLGGLCLAHGLRQVGIDVNIYERDTSADFRGQGYRVSLKSTGAGALHECLPAHLFALAAATSLRQPDRMVFTDEQLRPRFDKPIPAIEPGVDGFGVNRLTLREILLAELGSAVHFGKTFDRYEQLPGARVRAVFEDGADTTGDLIVGADGTSSAVRRQLIPDAQIDELHWMLYGRTYLDDERRAQLPEVLQETFNRATAPDGAAFAVATCRTREPVQEAAARLAPGVTLSDVPDYLSWTVPLAGPPGRDDDAGALHRAAVQTVEPFHPGVRQIVAEADVESTFPVCVTSAVPVRPWQCDAVTLLGDAVHTMSPGRGDGANIALKDAYVLREALALAAAGRTTLARAKAFYEQEMLEYGFAAVAASRHSPFGPRPAGRS
jgi:2-polyprenyl-6-methoxyphenol hydroxylase-like FAD-dependent oxidoreductase